MTTFRIRPGEPDDAAAMCRCYHRCWRIEYSDLVTPREKFDQMDPDRNLEHFAGWLAEDSGDRVFIAERDDDLVGYSTVVANQLVHLFIDPDHQGRGLGRTMLAAAEEHMVGAGHRTLKLHTRVGNVPAIGLYESEGWLVTDRLIHSVDDSGVEYDEHVMIKHVT